MEFPRQKSIGNQLPPRLWPSPPAPWLVHVCLAYNPAGLRAHCPYPTSLSLPNRQSGFCSDLVSSAVLSDFVLGESGYDIISCMPRDAQLSSNSVVDCLRRLSILESSFCVCSQLPFFVWWHEGCTRGVVIVVLVLLFGLSLDTVSSAVRHHRLTPWIISPLIPLASVSSFARLILSFSKAIHAQFFICSSVVILGFLCNIFSVCRHSDIRVSCNLHWHFTTPRPSSPPPMSKSGQHRGCWTDCLTPNMPAYLRMDQRD